MWSVDWASSNRELLRTGAFYPHYTVKCCKQAISLIEDFRPPAAGGRLTRSQLLLNLHQLVLRCVHSMRLDRVLWGAP